MASFCQAAAARHAHSGDSPRRSAIPGPMALTDVQRARRKPQVRGLTEELAALGVPRDGLLLVHASMRQARGVRTETMLAALRGALGPGGTVVVPAFTPENSDTSSAHHARIRGLDAHATAAFRAAMPPFDPAATPAPLMGALAETVRTAPGAHRSAHPQSSFAALGPAAAQLTAGHRPDCHLGDDSPLAPLYAGHARILLLGVGYDVCAAFHLAEYRVSRPPRRTYRCVIGPRSSPRWWAYEDVVLDDSDFGALGAAYAAACGTRPPGAGAGVLTGTVGGAPCLLLDLRDAVDFAVRHLPVLRADRSGAG